jgi:hypothetical protein
MNLVGATGNGAQITSNRGQSAGYYAPIVKTIIDNGGTNGNVVSGNITVKGIPFEKLKGVGDPFDKKSKKSENLLLNEAVEPLINMLNDWTYWMSTNGFSGKGSGDKKVYTYITSIFRDFAKQEQIKRDKTAEGKPNDAATPGTSPHGWAMAVDLQFFKKNGESINNTSNTPSSFKIDTNPAIKWLYDNSYMYGWVLPYTLRDGSKLDEHWHWEYHGTAAKCMVEANPTVYGYKMNTSGTVKSFVKNPKDSSGKEAVYTGCDYKYIKQGDGTESGGPTELGSSADFWSLMAICSVEAGIAQARCDVAQSIYNRLATPKQRYGKSIKEIIVSPGQYDPTKNSLSKWKLIKDEKTAIEALKASKGWSDTKAKKALTDTISALKNVEYQSKSKQFIETRTEFLGYYPKSNTAESVVHRKTPSDSSANGGNNYFFWKYAGKELIGKTPPNPPNLSNYS